MDQHLLLSSACESWGYGDVSWEGLGWAKSPGHPEGSPHPLPPIWPGSDHQALTTQGACPSTPLPVLTSGQHRDFSLQSSWQGRCLCSLVCVYMCVPL